jgi:hypothetical protein
MNAHSHIPHWTSALKLRPELVSNQGQVTGLQMSLYDAVYRTADVPYQEADYYSDITEPTPSLLRFLGTVAARLGAKKDLRALFHLDQGMGGGKSHALVGAYHMGRNPAEFFATDLGVRVREEASQIAGGDVNLAGARVVVMSADNMSPGKTNPVYGPATNLHERFLWSLFGGDKAQYEQFREHGSDKAALRAALTAASGPVLILLDELMDYVMQLSDAAHLASMPAEMAFLNALLDAVDDVPQVAFVVVMIRSDADERGYTEKAEDFREYVARRLVRNGTTVAVSEAQDFAAIIQRRIFERPNEPPPIHQLASWYLSQAGPTWRVQVFEKLGVHRGLTGFEDRLERTYPFHPDLMSLVRDDWARHTGFQRVRSTVAIFAAAAHHWVQQAKAGAWAPTLIGTGDLPLTIVREDVLSSGLLHGNERAVQGFRQVAATDVASEDGSHGKAVEIDRTLTASGLSLGQPTPALRMATALFYYSLVPRGQAKRGATRAEILAAAFEPDPSCEFGNAETVFNALVSEEEGLGALDTQTGTGGAPTRYQLSTHQTVRMFYRSARSSIQDGDRDLAVWKRAQQLATAGLFDEVIAVSRPEREDTPIGNVFGEVDQNGKNRLVVLDPRRWTLLNGRDSPTRADILALLGHGPDPLAVDNAASCVVACVNTQRREVVRKRAVDALAWRGVLALLDVGSEQREEAEREVKEAERKFDEDLRKAYQHFAYLVRTADGTQVVFGRFDDDSKSALRGEHVWEELRDKGRAVRPHALSGVYLAALLAQMPRNLSIREVTQQFKKNPAFPLVSDDHDIRVAIVQTLTADEPYEVVSAEGGAFTIASPNDIALGSTDQFLRPVVKEPLADVQEEGYHGVKISPSGGSVGVDGLSGVTAGESSGGSGATSPVTYTTYTIRVPNRSLVDDAKRNAIWALLSALSDAADPQMGPDLQLIDLSIRITAEEGSLAIVQQKAEAADAKWSEELDDLFT